MRAINLLLQLRERRNTDTPLSPSTMIAHQLARLYMYRSSVFRRAGAFFAGEVDDRGRNAEEGTAARVPAEYALCLAAQSRYESEIATPRRTFLASVTRLCFGGQRAMRYSISHSKSERSVTGPGGRADREAHRLTSALFITHGRSASPRPFLFLAPAVSILFLCVCVCLYCYYGRRNAIGPTGGGSLLRSLSAVRPPMSLYRSRTFYLLSRSEWLPAPPCILQKIKRAATGRDRSRRAIDREVFTIVSGENGSGVYAQFLPPVFCFSPLCVVRRKMRSARKVLPSPPFVSRGVGESRETNEINLFGSLIQVAPNCVRVSLSLTCPLCAALILSFMCSSHLWQRMRPFLDLCQKFSASRISASYNTL